MQYKRTQESISSWCQLISKDMLLSKVLERVLFAYFQGKKNVTRPQRISEFLDRSITFQVSLFPLRNGYEPTFPLHVFPTQNHIPNSRFLKSSTTFVEVIVKKEKIPLLAINLSWVVFLIQSFLDSYLEYTEHQSFCNFNKQPVLQVQ